MKINRFKILLTEMKRENYKVFNFFQKLSHIYYILFPIHYENGYKKRVKKYRKN